jgi:hypothetical protein
MPECQNCGAPGGYPYCSEGCRIAANPEDYPDYDDTPTVCAADFGPLTDVTDPWATDARNRL